LAFLARAPGRQIQGAATQAMWWHRRGSRASSGRAPQGCGSDAQTNYCGSPIMIQGIEPQQNAKLFLREP